VRGMPHLLRLRAAGVPVWPFDDVSEDGTATGPFVAEVYPRWCTGPVIKRLPAARAHHLAALGPAIPEAARDVATASEDAFDAACTAVAMSRGRCRPPTADGHDRVEGRILAPPA
jgi:hypothetical protein